MAWTDPITFVSGNVLTAAQMNVIQANLLAGGPAYATEAARNTAIPSPFEGQRAYITGSTETTASGAVTAIPTGIQTIYNGSGWVTVTPVGVSSNTSSTYTSTSYGTTCLTGDTAALSVTLRTGATAKIELSGWGPHSAAGGALYLGIDVSGAATIAAIDQNASVFNAGGIAYNGALSRSYVLVTGMTAGVNTFRLNYKTTGATATYSARSLVVTGIA